MDKVIFWDFHGTLAYNVWMVGDSIAADVRGPKNAGIKGILVRSKREDSIRYHSNDLLGLREIIK